MAVVAPPMVPGGLYHTIDPDTKQSITAVMASVVADPGKVARGYFFIPEWGGTVSVDDGSHRLARMALISRPYASKTTKPVYGTYYKGDTEGMVAAKAPNE